MVSGPDQSDEQSRLNSLSRRGFLTVGRSIAAEYGLEVFGAFVVGVGAAGTLALKAAKTVPHLSAEELSKEPGRYLGRRVVFGGELESLGERRLMFEMSPKGVTPGLEGVDQIGRSLHLFRLMSQVRDANVYVVTKDRGRAALLEQEDIGQIVGVVIRGSWDGKEIFCVEVSE